jgi:hypothetical protein
VLPLRVCTSTRVPAGTVASQRTRPQVETVSVSLTFETNVPAAASRASRACRRPGFDVDATIASPSRPSAVTCSAGSVATIAHDRSSRRR